MGLGADGNIAMEDGWCMYQDYVTAAPAHLRVHVMLHVAKHLHVVEETFR